MSDIVQFFDEWELVLPPDAREALRPIAERARSAGKRPKDGGYTAGSVSDGGRDPRDRVDLSPRYSGPARKPIRTDTAVGTTRDGYLFRVTVATCDDGTLWRLSDTESGEQRWERLPSIPHQ